jgi:cytochrome bd-type quinol oxidase subunit 1
MVQSQWYGFVDAGFIIGFVSVLPATLSVVARYRRAESVERQQIKWLLAATTLLALAFIVGALSSESNQAPWWVVACGMAAIPISILFAVLRYRLYDIDRILSRTVSYVIVIGLLAGVYLFGLTAMTNFLPSDSSLSVAASTLAVAALFNPLRRRVQAWVERRFNRSRYDAQQVMERFSGSLRQDLDQDTVVTGWVGVVSETMQPVSAAVWIRNDFGTMER